MSTFTLIGGHFQFSVSLDSPQSLILESQIVTCSCSCRGWEAWRETRELVSETPCDWKNAALGTEGSVVNKAFPGHPVTPAGAGRVGTGNRAVWQGGIHTCIYHWWLSGARVHWTSPNLCPPIHPPPKRIQQSSKLTLWGTFRLRGRQLLQQSKPVRNHLIGEINKITKFLGNNRASNMDADAKQLREKWYPSQCKQYIPLMASHSPSWAVEH